MSDFDAVVVAALVASIAIPLWIISAVLFGARRQEHFDPSARFFAYARLLEILKLGSGDFRIENGALWVAAIRELRAYPEFADISILYLEEIEVTGSNKFDRIMDAELKATEAHLLENRS